VVPWLWLVYAESLAPMRLMDWRGRMRRIEATCSRKKLLYITFPKYSAGEREMKSGRRP
jgi:hypothetical protein